MESMPGGSAPQPAAPAGQPRSIALAVKLMYVGAALSLLGILVTLFMRDTIREAVEKASADASTPMTQSQMDGAVAIAIGFSVVVGLIGVALWLWMAWANGRGRSWARIVATVLFVLSVLSSLGSLVQRPPALSLAATFISLVLGAFTLVLLWRLESSRWYEAQSAPRY
jgi:hypothetical protein